MAIETGPVLTPPRGGVDIGDYTLRDFAAKWLEQQCDLAGVDRYRDANEALLHDPDARRRIVLMGDSITEFWTAAGTLSGVGWRAVNRGIAGQNATQMLVRFQADVVALGPAAVVLLCGTNDLRCYVGAPASIAQSALDRISHAVASMADICTAHSILLAVATLPPVGRQVHVHRDANALRAVNRWIASFAVNRGLPLIDYYAALANAEGLLTEDVSDDGVHPDNAGYTRMMTPLLATLATLGFDVTKSSRRLSKEILE
jgi:lysophospholipase L1-like esterase